MSLFRFPSKTFLLGEYAILQGAPALLLGHGPHFEAAIDYGTATGHPSPFHPESPAGKWLKENPLEGKITFRDPHRGAGGFGGSGAEFLSAWAPQQELPPENAPRAIFAWNAWEESRGFPGSGADILVQAYGMNRESPFFLKVDIEHRNLTEVFQSPVATSGVLSLFATGKKANTHEQKVPANLPSRELGEIVERAEIYLESGMLEGLAVELNAYGAKMAELGLVASHTMEALKTLPREALAAKGCGAMGSDVVLVLHHGMDLDAWANANSFVPVGNFPV